MQTRKATRSDEALAKVCLKCPVCREARRRQRGAAYWLVRKVEGHICPFCRAYERVFGRQAHLPTVSSQNSGDSENTP
jgi:hypothetical protein